MDMEVDQENTQDRMQTFLQELASAQTGERTRILESIMPLVARMKHEPHWKVGIYFGRDRVVLEAL